MGKLIESIFSGWTFLADPFPAEFLGRTPLKTTYTELWIKLPTGPDVYAHVHRPIDKAAVNIEYPGVIIVPGGGSPGTAYDGDTEVTADDIAALGAIVLHYDPTGRGRTAGDEDYWGTRHQRELSGVIEHFFNIEGVNRGNAGIMAFSIGITTAAGALCRFPVEGCEIKFLFDWEGPSNRVNITKNDTHKPLKDFPMSNEEFWKEREAAAFIGGISCNYFRYQAETDHMQTNYKGHAIELLNKARDGQARSTRCNDNPPDILYDACNPEAYHWVPTERNHKGQILKYLLELQNEI